MNALIEKILNIISNLPDPVGLTKVVQKIEESDNTLGFDEAKNLLLNNLLRIQTGRKGVIIDHVK